MPGRWDDHAGNAIWGQVECLLSLQQDVRRKGLIRLVHQAGFQKQASKPTGCTEAHRFLPVVVRQVPDMGKNRGVTALTQCPSFPRMINMSVGYDDQLDIAQS